MPINPLAGKPASPDVLVDVSKLVTAYFTEMPDPRVPSERVSFGTSGHRGSSFSRSFNEEHILLSLVIMYDQEKEKWLKPD